MSNKLALACSILLLALAWAAPATADPGRGSTVLCYVWANNPTAAVGAPYVPSTFYSYNAVGKSNANTVTRNGVGIYTVVCKGVGGGALFAGSGTWGPGGHVQVTAYGSEDADYCKVSSWSTGGPDFSVGVRCYNANGALSDNRFDMLFVW